MNVRATDIIKAIEKLNSAKKHRLREYLIDALTASSSTGTVLQEISERKNKSGYHCPDCESEHIVRFGKYSTIVDGEEVKKQRYRCKACRKTFTDLTNTALYRTRRLHQWIKFIECIKGWIQRFNGVATKFLNNYLAWFQVLESIQHQRNEVTMNDLMIKGNLIQNIETYDTLRLSKFTI
jgi:transposase-like protein